MDLAVAREVHAYVKRRYKARGLAGGEGVGGREVRVRENRAWNLWTPKDSSERASGLKKNRKGERERITDRE